MTPFGRSADLEIGDTAGLETCATLQRRLRPVLDPLAALEAALQAYEQIKEQLAEARFRFRSLAAEFVNELNFRRDAMNDDQKRALVLELFAQDVQTGLDAAAASNKEPASFPDSSSNFRW